jgi:hypothetical protein
VEKVSTKEKDCFMSFVTTRKLPRTSDLADMSSVSELTPGRAVLPHRPSRGTAGASVLQPDVLLTSTSVHPNCGLII